MIVQGVDISALPDQFQSAVPGRTLIIDGDGPCYVAAATVKRLDTALRNFQQEILKRMFLAGASDCRIHLTSRDSDKHGRFRVKASKPYQGNRKNKSKPPLLEPLRELVADNSTWLDDYSVLLHRALEADDGMIQDAYRLGGNGVIYSEDKDLRMTPYPYYEIDRGQVQPSQPVGWVSIKHTPSGTPKLTGQGPLFFWAQMLMGDTADNVQGVARYNGKLCGAVGAFDVLKDVRCIHDASNIVLDAYREINQNAVAEGWLLWLTRWHKDNVIQYMRELNLTPANRDFIEDCVLRDWVIPKGVADERDTNDE